MSKPFEPTPLEKDSFTLVGQFLWHFAYMETAINDTVATALDLEDIRKYVVTKNISFRDKLHIIKACIALVFPDKTQANQLRKSITKNGDFGATRNMIAHTMFGPDGEGVLFLTVKASDKVSLANTKWEKSDFYKAFERLDEFTEELRLIEQKIKSQNLFRSIAMKIENGQTMPENARKGLASLLFPQNQGALDSDPTPPNQETPPQSSTKPQA